VRRAYLADVPALLRIENAAFPCDRINHRQFRYLLQRPSVVPLVFSTPRGVTGYILTFVPRGARVARIYSVAVDESERGLGVGGHLLRATVAEAIERGYEELRLEVRALDEAAQRFYARFGFEATETLLDYYEDHADALRLVRRLEAPATQPWPSGRSGSPAVERQPSALTSVAR
jgi:ribosomal protein S18 acetylase RimI-like enzyme